MVATPDHGDGEAVRQRRAAWLPGTFLLMLVSMLVVTNGAGHLVRGVPFAIGAGAAYHGLNPLLARYGQTTGSRPGDLSAILRPSFYRFFLEGKWLSFGLVYSLGLSVLTVLAFVGLVAASLFDFVS
ncbi:hypothetical protein [Marmoricola sp. RAF53]|uniref:hypothetical protein n=1 Tax=Marmoricola sp. RAF53 TaxID=3233059 RepID=UPI003F9C20AB